MNQIHSLVAGTNDLGMGLDGETILATLCSMHDNARASGARTVCLAVPPFALEKVGTDCLSE